MFPLRFLFISSGFSVFSVLKVILRFTVFQGIKLLSSGRTHDRFTIGCVFDLHWAHAIGACQLQLDFLFFVGKEGGQGRGRGRGWRGH